MTLGPSPLWQPDEAIGVEFWLADTCWCERHQFFVVFTIRMFPMLRVWFTMVERSDFRCLEVISCPSCSSPWLQGLKNIKTSNTWLAAFFWLILGKSLSHWNYSEQQLEFSYFVSIFAPQLRRLRDVKRHNSLNVAENDIRKDVFMNRMHSSDAFFRRSVKNHPIQSLPSAVTLERKCLLSVNSSTFACPDWGAERPAPPRVIKKNNLSGSLGI